MKRGYLRRKTPLRAKTGIRRKKKAHKTKGKDPRLWTLDRADTEFSLWVRNRDGKCMYPTCQVYDIKKLQCSHYFGRQHKGTRFDPDNCIALCWLHHFKDKLLGLEYQKQTIEQHGYDGGYTTFTKKLIGEARFYAMKARATGTYPQTRAIMECMELLGKPNSTT